MNSLQNLIKKVSDGSINKEPGFVGPAITMPSDMPSQPIRASIESAGPDNPINWQFGMPASLWPPYF